RDVRLGVQGRLTTRLLRGRTLCKEPVETGFVENGDAELLGLRELRARALAYDDVARLLRHAADDLAAARFDLARRFVACAALERAGEDEGQADQRRLVGGDGARGLAGEVHAGRPQSRDQARVAIDREPRAQALRDRRSDAVDRGQLVFARVH